MRNIFQNLSHIVLKLGCKLIANLFLLNISIDSEFSVLKTYAVVETIERILPLK
jgi:hypothetical protein